MTGIDAEPYLARMSGAMRVLLEHGRMITGSECNRVGLRIELDAVGVHGLRAVDACDVGVDEQRDADACCMQLGDERAKAIAVAREVPAVIGRLLFRRVGHERDLLGLYVACERHELGCRIAFDVEFDGGVRGFGQQRRELVDVASANVPLVGPRMHGDPMRACSDDDAGHVDDARVADVSLVA